MNVRAIVVATVVCLSLSACASSSPKKLPICDGKPKHRRPANPYGTVLPGVPVTAAPAGSGERPAAMPSALPPKTSAAAPSSYFRSC